MWKFENVKICLVQLSNKLTKLGILEIWKYVLDSEIVNLPSLEIWKCLEQLNS